MPMPAPLLKMMNTAVLAGLQLLDHGGSGDHLGMQAKLWQRTNGAWPTSFVVDLERGPCGTSRQRGLTPQHAFARRRISGIDGRPILFAVPPP